MSVKSTGVCLCVDREKDEEVAIRQRVEGINGKENQEIH